MQDLTFKSDLLHLTLLSLCSTDEGHCDIGRGRRRLFLGVPAAGSRPRRHLGAVQGGALEELPLSLGGTETVGNAGVRCRNQTLT